MADEDWAGKGFGEAPQARFEVEPQTVERGPVWADPTPPPDFEPQLVVPLEDLPLSRPLPKALYGNLVRFERPEDMGAIAFTIVHTGKKSPIEDVVIDICAGVSGRITLQIGGGGHRVHMGSGHKALDLRMWRSSTMRMGTGTTVNGCSIILDHCDIDIGTDVMFSSEMLVQGHDQHGLVDLASGRIVNLARSRVSVGDHVWGGRRANFMPGTRIGQGSVIGYGSIVTQPIPPFCLAVGVPARVIRQDQSWLRGTERPTESERVFFARHGFPAVASPAHSLG